jgi:hypothetical protein
LTPKVPKALGEEKLVRFRSSEIFFHLTQTVPSPKPRRHPFFLLETTNKNTFQSPKYSLLILLFMTYPTNWNLARYFYSGLDDAKLASDIAQILPRTIAFAEKYEKTFASFIDSEQILEFYTDYTTLSHEMATPSYYLFYRSSLDTQDLDVTKKMGEVDYIHTEASNRLLFVAQGWKFIGYDRIMTWANDPKLAKYKNDLISTANSIKYILSEREEYVLNMKSRPLGLANSLHDELTGSYEFTMNIDGVEKKLTEEEVRELTGVEQKKALPVLHWLISMVRGRGNCVVVKYFSSENITTEDVDVTLALREFR